jgi:4-phosphopantoate---beta-alanine ligase
MRVEVPADHPRAASIRIRERLIHQWSRGVVADAGLIAHGRGEAFDYLLGERTTRPALEATRAAAARLLLARRAVISVNGNAAALVPRDLVELSAVAGAALEVNLFYRSQKRLRAVASLLRKAGARRVLGLGASAAAPEIPELSSMRRIVDPEGIFAADVVLVPLEDGDRVEALRRMGKATIAVDLNPLSRTSQAATITIVDNIVRALPNLVSTVREMKRSGRAELSELAEGYDNGKQLGASMGLMMQRLAQLSRTGGVSEEAPIVRRARR